MSHGELRVRDMETFLSVGRLGSISAAARHHGVTPGQVSKAIARIEEVLSVKLFSRIAHGMLLSAKGRAVLEIFERVVNELDGLQRQMAAGIPEFAIAGLSYVVGFFATDIEEALPDYRLRCLAMNPAVLRGHAGDAVFDAALTIGKERLGNPWVATAIGTTSSALFASPHLAKRLHGPRVTESTLATVPFIGMIQVVDGRVVPADDGCPMGARRTRGQEVEMLGLGFELASKNHQLVFGPRIAAAAYLASGRLEELTVEDWSESNEERVYLYCNGDRVRKATQTAIVASCRRALERRVPSRA